MDSKHAFCNYCKSSVFRGSCKSTYVKSSTFARGLHICNCGYCRGRSHLTNVASTSTFATSETGSHKKATKYQKSPMQQTLTRVIDKTSRFKLYKRSTITHIIAKLICVDGQPLNIVVNRGFTELINHLEPRFTMPSRKTLSNVIIPTTYDSAVKNIRKLSCSTCLDVPFPEVSNTTKKNFNFGQNVVAVVRDNARNIAVGLELSPFNHTACLAHTLQLVLKEGFLSNKIINNLVSSCRKLVGQFKHSACATKVLKTCKITAGVAQHRLIQEESTRWNTTLHLLKRLYEQKRSILLASAELNIPELSNCQWTFNKNNHYN
ncbi:hypothetical protein PR048_023373 [Dryococelus australis]|uniref:Transposase n=1 Tax=Dryococelus australis TaxID=614101 RepID=A0ABQ9GTZ4_9NEOP|nr:hypothetical protein PR048_023373 [Dryococelus australis]